MKQRAASRVRARILQVLAFGLAATLVGACGGSGSVTKPPVPGVTTTGITGTVPAAEDALLAYGYAPDPHGSAVYQPDVVLVGGGPQIVRSVSDDGLTWTIDAHAPNADKL